MRTRALALTSLLLALGCQPVPMTGSGPGPSPTPPGDDGPAVAPGCDVRFVAEVIEGDVLVVRAHNQTGAEISLSLPDACPDGPIGFEGLPAGFQYYVTCAAGMCPGDLPPLTFTIPAGGQQEIVQTHLELEGGTCNQAVVLGSYSVRPVVPDIGLRVCAQAAVVTVGGERSVAQVPVPAADPHACTADADCEVYCPAVAGCCGWSCGCRNAINRSQRDAFTAAYASRCDKTPDCPAMACAYEPADSAACVNGRCRARDGL